MFRKISAGCGQQLITMTPTLMNEINTNNFSFVRNNNKFLNLKICFLDAVQLSFIILNHSKNVNINWYLDTKLQFGTKHISIRKSSICRSDIVLQMSDLVCDLCFCFNTERYYIDKMTNQNNIDVIQAKNHILRSVVSKLSDVELWMVSGEQITNANT